MLKSLKSYDDFISMKKKYEKQYERDKVKIYICMTGCRALGAEEVCDEFKKQLNKQKFKDKVEIVETGCQACAQGRLL